MEFNLKAHSMCVIPTPAVLDKWNKCKGPLHLVLVNHKGMDIFFQPNLMCKQDKYAMDLWFKNLFKNSDKFSKSYTSYTYTIQIN